MKRNCLQKTKHKKQEQRLEESKKKRTQFKLGKNYFKKDNNNNETGEAHQNKKNKKRQKIHNKIHKINN